jgi:hypothetical protein
MRPPEQTDQFAAGFGRKVYFFCMLDKHLASNTPPSPPPVVLISKPWYRNKIM